MSACASWKIQVFWDITLRLLGHEDEGTAIPRNVTQYLPRDTE